MVGFVGVLGVGGTYSPEIMQAKASMQQAQQPKPKGKPIPTAIDAANAVCFIAGRRGMDCEVDMLNARITIPQTMSEREAKASCLDMVRALSPKTKQFNDRGWTFWITHPKTKRKLASCGII